MKREVPQNLTFEEFKELADRKPSMEGDWLYHLTHETLVDDYSYPEFGIADHHKYLFRTLEDAEKYMREKLAPENKHYDTYRFLIKQVPVGEWERFIGATWVYDKDGRLVETATSCHQYGHYPESYFFGRSENRIRFHEGDIVEVVFGDTVHLAIVGAEPPTVEWFWGLYNRSKDYGYNTDCGDDNYYVVDGPGCHDHPHSTMVMKPSRPIPQDIKEYFEECLAMSKRQDVKYDTRMLGMDSMNMFDTKEAYIKLNYVSSLNRHQLVIRVINNITDTKSDRVLPTDFSEKELNDICEWLNFKKYNRTRLWYLIREWNNEARFMDEPELSPDTPLEELLKQ